ncbi:MAG: hypothetical protein WCS95_05795 [Lentisphaeria bacterium]|jgi:hypothetical protein|nr:hypothetical protein [Lentisphaeria bacterium]
MIKNVMLFFLAAAFFSLLQADLIVGLQQQRGKEQLVTVNLEANLRQIVVPRLHNPALDGGEAGWQQCFSEKGFSITRLQAETRARAMQATGDWENFMDRALKPQQDSQVYLGYDDEFLYLRVDCFEDSMHNLGAFPNAKRDDPVYNGDCIDLTLCKNRNALSYVQIVIDHNGAVFDTMNQRIPAKDERGRGKISYVSDKTWSPDFPVHVSKRADFWRLTLALPFKECGIQVGEGDFVDINVCRNEMPSKELSSWGPVDSSFHESDKMLRLWLGEQNSPKVTLTQLNYGEPRVGKNILRLQATNKSAESFAGLLDMSIESSQGTQKISQDLVLQAGVSKFLALPWQAELPDTYALKCVLEKDGQALDSCALTSSVPAPLKLMLSKSTFFSSSRQIPASIQIAVNDAQRYELHFKLLNQGKTLKKQVLPNIVAGELEFLVDVEAMPGGSAEFVVELVDKQSQQVLDSQSATMSRQADPFDFD